MKLENNKEEKEYYKNTGKFYLITMIIQIKLIKKYLLKNKLI